MNNPRTTIRFMLFFLVMLLIAPFFVNGPDGKPIMTWDKFKQRFFASLPSAPEMPAITNKVSPATTPDPKQTVYKWKDGKGVWHFTNETPPAEANEVSVVKGTVNRMQFAKPIGEKGGSNDGNKTASGDATGENLPMAPGMPFSQNTVKEVLDEAKKARKDANQYNKNLEQAVNNM